MINEIHVRMDSNLRPHIVMSKPPDPKKDLEGSIEILADIATISEALVVLMHKASHDRVQPLGQTLEDVVGYLRKGAANSDYKTM